MVARVFRRAFRIFRQPGFWVPFAIFAALPAGLESALMPPVLFSPDARVALLSAPGPAPSAVLPLPEANHIFGPWLNETAQRVGPSGLAVALLAAVLIVSLLGFWLSQTFVALAIALAREQPATFIGELLPIGKVARLVVAEILVSAAAGLGLLFFVVPGVFVLVVWSQVRALIIDQGATVSNAFGRSVRLTKGSRPEILVIYIALVVGAMIGSGLSGLALLARGRLELWLILVAGFLPVEGFWTAAVGATYAELLEINRSATPQEASLAARPAQPSNDLSRPALTRRPARAWRIAVGGILLLAFVLIPYLPSPRGGVPERLGILIGIFLLVVLALWLITTGLPKWIGSKKFTRARRLAWLVLLGAGLAVATLVDVILSMQLLFGPATLVAGAYWFGWTWISWLMADAETGKRFLQEPSTTIPGDVVD